MFGNIILKRRMRMKTDKVLTVGQLKRWCDDNNISDDTPIAKLT